MQTEGTGGPGRNEPVGADARRPNPDRADPGTAHLLNETHLITVYFENKPFEIKRGVYTTEELMRIFSVQPGYILEVINDEGHLTPLKPGEKLEVKEGLRFFEQVPCGGSS